MDVPATVHQLHSADIPPPLKSSPQAMSRLSFAIYQIFFLSCWNGGSALGGLLVILITSKPKKA